MSLDTDERARPQEKAPATSWNSRGGTPADWSVRRWAIVLLTLATAVIHIHFFFPNPRREWIFLLNGLGYLGLLTLLYGPLGLPGKLHRWVRPMFIGYTALTIAAYVFFSLQLHSWSLWWGPISKALEIVLIALLWIEGLGPTESATD